MGRYLQVITTLFFFICIFGNAQNVGYIGKKISIDIGASVAPSFAKSVLSYPSSYYDSTAMKKKQFHGIAIRIYPELNVAYTVGRHIEVGGRLGFQQYKLSYYTYTSHDLKTTYHWNLQPYSANSTYNYFNLKNSIVTGQSMLTEVSLRYYRKKQIAPVGAYFCIGYGAYHSRIKGGELIEGFVQDKNGNSEGRNIENNWITLRRISFGYHRKRVYNKNLYSDIGLEMAFSSGVKYRKQSSSSDSYINYGYIANTQSKYLGWENFATIKFAVGKIF